MALYDMSVVVFEFTEKMLWLVTRKTNLLIKQPPILFWTGLYAVVV
jgi:hypothetical protein